MEYYVLCFFFPLLIQRAHRPLFIRYLLTRICLYLFIGSFFSQSNIQYKRGSEIQSPSFPVEIRVKGFALRAQW